MDDNSNQYKNLKIPYKFDSRYVSEDSISRIFRLLSEIKTIDLLITNTNLPYIFSDNNEPILFDYILKEASSFDSYKELIWILTCKQISTPIKLIFNLTENTVDNTVLVVLEMSIVKRELVPDKYKIKIINNFESITVDVINNMIIKLKNDNKDIYHYESKVFNYSREKVKNLIFNLKDIFKERGDIISFKSEGNNSEGEIITFTLKKENKVIKLKINKINIDEKDLKWTVSYMPLNVDFTDFLINWIIIKLKPNQTQVAIINTYTEQVSQKILKDLTRKKKELFDIMEEELKKRYPN